MLTKFFAKSLSLLKDPRVALPVATGVGTAAVAGGTWFATRSWMIAIAVALAIALVVLILVLLRTLRSEERDERLVGGLEGAQSREAKKGDLDSSGSGIRSIFETAIGDIRRSKLGASGLQVLPWWLILGSNGSGKTELIRSAGLEVPAEFAHRMRAGATNGCNIILTNQAVILDTPGEFLDSGEKPSADWSALLQLLRKHRPGGPLEGLVVTLSAASLVHDEPAQLEEIGRRMRRRFNEVVDALGFDVPIYIVVTQIDRVQGFLEFITSLPAERSREVFGWTNDRRDIADVAQAHRLATRSVIDQVDQILTELIVREPDLIRSRNLYLFPQELSALCDRAEIVIRSAFAPSVFDEVPFLRGLYFTSSMRDGSTVSSIAASLGHPWAVSGASNVRVAGGGIFSTGLFREVLLGDDELAVESGGMGRRSRRVVVGLVAAASILFLGFSGVSFVGNLLLIRDLEVKTKRLVGAPSSLDAANSLRESIVASRAPGAVLNVPLMGKPRLGATDRATATFLEIMDRENVGPAKARIEEIVRRADTDAFDALAVLAMDLTWLTNRAKSDSSFRPDIAQFSPFSTSERDRAAFDAMYDAFITWSSKDTLDQIIEDERNVVLELAGQVLDLRRLEEWSDRHREQQPPVRHSDFGWNDGSGMAGSSVASAYTRQGWEGLVRDLLEAVEDSGAAADDRIARFQREYISRFDESWRSFLLSTPTDVRPNLAVLDSPHLELFDRVTEEISADLPRDDARPAWMTLALGIRGDVSREGVESSQEGSPKDTSESWDRYQAALDQVSAEVGEPMPQDSDKALKTALAMSDASSFGAALSLIDELVPRRGETLESKKIREILAMPVIDAGAAVLLAAIPELNQRWYEEIYRPYAEEAQDLVSLYDPDDGALSKFMTDELGPFFERNEPKKLLADLTLPLSVEFIGWLDKSRSMQRSLFPGSGTAVAIPIRLEGVPSKITGSEGVFVTRRDLILECPSSVQTFEYREGTSSVDFAWTPDCQRVSLRIWVTTAGEPTRELLPRKEWTGPLALARFFQESTSVGGGEFQRRFDYEDFEVQVAYRMRSGQALLGLKQVPPPSSLDGQKGRLDEG